MRSQLLASLLLFAAACDHAADPAAVRARISRDLPDVIDQSTSASDGASPVAAALGQGLDALDLLAPGLVPATSSTSLKRLAAAPAIGDAGQTGADVANDLNTQLFTDANYQGDGVFAIPTDLLCPATDGIVDPACVDQAQRAQLRIRAELADHDGLAFTLQVGAGHAEPFSLGLSPHLLEASVDLGEVADAARSLDGVLDPTLTVELEGVISARLEVLGPAHVAAAITIDRAIHVAISDAADPSAAFSLDSAVAHPLARIELDGVAAQGTAQLGLGSTQLHLASDTGTDPAIDVDLPGAAATATLTAGQLQVTGISLGDRTTTVSVGGQRAIAVDLNRDRGRTLDLTVTGDDLAATFAVSPALDLRVAVDHAVLGDEPPRFDVTRVALDGAATPTLAATTDPATGTSQLAVVAGQLTVETNPTGYGATIAAGQCVGEEWRTDAAGDYSVLVATTCL